MGGVGWVGVGRVGWKGGVAKLRPCYRAPVMATEVPVPILYIDFNRYLGGAALTWPICHDTQWYRRCGSGSNVRHIRH